MSILRVVVALLMVTALSMSVVATIAGARQLLTPRQAWPPIVKPSPERKEQGISGTVYYGPLPEMIECAHTEPEPASFEPGKIVIRTASGDETFVSMNWVMASCELRGTFRVPLAPGTYSLDFTACTSSQLQRVLSCPYLPMTVEVKPNTFVPFYTYVDTGIR